MAHGVLLGQNTGLRWGVPTRYAEAALPVEFVKGLPPSPLLAPMPPGNGRSKEPPAHGPGPIVPERVKRAGPRRTLTPAQRLAAWKRIQERRAMMARVKADRARAALERRLEAQAKAREAAARRKAYIEEQRRVKAQRRAEVETQLAVLSDPDERISDAAASGSPGNGEAFAENAAPAAIPQDLGDQVYDPGGREGRDAMNVKPVGGGFGDPDGGPVSWSLSGPAGNRRLLKRRIPSCPDWVSARNLDLKVQLRFRVLDDGSVQAGVLVRKTSGFPALDREAVSALKGWRFEAFQVRPGTRPPETWGVVTFRFVSG